HGQVCRTCGEASNQCARKNRPMTTTRRSTTRGRVPRSARCRIVTLNQENPMDAINAPQHSLTNLPALDFNAIKQRQQATWPGGDFAIIGTTLQIVGETLAEAANVRAGERVLDVA